jgi:hypothetical protein
MFKQAMMAMAILSAALLGGSTAVQARIDPLRCEARRAGCEQRYFRCMSRCAVGAGPVDPDAGLDPCETRCDQRHDEMMKRINGKPPCSGPPPKVDPNDCEVQLLTMRRAFLVRVANCLERTRDGFDVASCEAAAQLAC